MIGYDYFLIIIAHHNNQTNHSSDNVKNMDNKKTKEAEFKIEIDELFPKFEEHLEIKNNKRILFSGKFGIGKTYFLNDFFENKKDKYNVFHLFPVNYQITSNENIIEFLKYDILVELMKNKDIFKNDNNEDVGMIDYIKKDFNMNSFLKNTVSQIINPIPQIGKILGKPLKTTLEFDKQFQKFREGNEGVIKDFLKKNNTETDCLSQILKNKIENSKNEKQNEKQSVLILDDLERIDPEHIFRILNIFSAHLDSQNEELPNKFGFDKIILVADVQNLKSIFYHRYGAETDFNGYFNKFFSVEIFQFKNEEIIAKAIDDVISNFQVNNKNLNGALESDGYLRIFLWDVLLKSLKLEGEEKLDLRKLLKGVKYQIQIFKNTSCKSNLSGGRDVAIPKIINISIEFFISIFSGMEIDFISVLRKIKNNVKSRENVTRGIDALSYYFLKATDEKNENGWNGYSMEIEDERIKSATKSNKEISISALFFDLLIEYVSKEKYKQKN